METNTTKFVILGILSNNPRTGYDIRKVVKTRMGSYWDVGYSQIYPTLRILEKEGFITKKLEINETGPNRKVYSITIEGKKKLQDWLTTPAKPETFKCEVLLKIAFGEQVPKEEIIKHFKELKKRYVAQLENLLMVEKDMKANLNDIERRFFALLTLELGKSLHRTTIEWADKAIKTMENIDKNDSNA
jgi:DNA-binding PadR family transcriptional regulator